MTNPVKLATIAVIDNGNDNGIIPQEFVFLHMNKRATIKEVAQAAGVSTQTVSRVINDRPDVSPETRERVRQIIIEMDFQPSALARSLIQNRSYTLGVVTAGLKFIGPSRTLNGITNKAAELGYSLILEELPRFEANQIKPLIQELLSRHVDGIVWAVPEVGDNRDWVDGYLSDIPVPVIFLTMQPRPGITTISVDNYLGGTLATRHLLEIGCKSIGHIAGPQDWWEARRRKEAWKDSLDQAGRKIDERMVVEGNWSSSSGAQAFLKLLETYPGMDGVFVGNDQMALTVLQIAHNQGLRIPEDLAVVGFDNIAESAYFWPPLTTVNHNQHELGGCAVEEAVKQIESARQNEKIEPRAILITPELIVRKSTSK